MAFFSWSRWLRSLYTPKARPIRRRSTTLRLEQLETRLAPATDIWTGGGLDNKWMTAANWTNGTPNPGDDLVFGQSGAKQLTNVNNFAAGTNFNSITFANSGYSISGSSITLGSTATGATGQIQVNSSALGETLALAINLAGAAGGAQQVITVGSGGSLTISGPLSGSAGAGLDMTGGTGTLTLSGNNVAFTGAFTIDQGTVVITNSQALGTTTAPTVVHSGGQLQLAGGFAGLSIAEPLKLNGSGGNSLGALYNASSNNVLTGTVELDSNATIGAAANTLLTINGIVNDTGSSVGHNLTKEDAGTVLLEPFGSSAGNTYRGNTTVNGGILEIAHPFALGVGAGQGGGTALVNANPSESGSLALVFDPAAVALGNLIIPAADLVTDPASKPIGFKVPNELLTLNGLGVAGLHTAPRDFFSRSTGPVPAADVVGALNNQSGQNAWEQPITLWTSSSNIALPSDNQWFFNYLPAVTIGAASGSTLTIDGTIGDNNPQGTLYSLSKVGLGRVVLTSANTFVANVDVLQGYLRITDSEALGAPSGLSKTVWWGAGLELQSDGIPDSLGGLHKPGQNQYDLLLPAPDVITLNGTGVANDGALRSIAGTNYIEGDVVLQSSSAIDVEPDPDPANAGGQPWNDFSQLTIDGPVTGANLTKVGLGELVLTAANGYGNTDIQQGWITARNDLALSGNNVTVEFGAALVLKPDLQGNSLTLTDNIQLAGTGITHRFPWLNQLGALLNLGGINTITGTITLNGTVGIGVELDGGVTPTPPPSQLTLQGETEEVGGLSGPGGITKLGTRRLILQGPGIYTGPVDVKTGVLLDQNSTALGAGVSTTTVESGAALEMASGTTYENGGLQPGDAVYGEHLVLNGAGDATFNDSALNVLAPGDLTHGPVNTQMVLSDSLWHGPVTLASSATIQAAAGTRLVLAGNIDDTGGSSDLTLNGGGEVNLAGTNTFHGTTDVQAGSLSLASNKALGDTGTAEVQSLTLTGATAGTTQFTLDFNGQKTNPIPYTGTSADATAIQMALNALGTVGGADVGGSIAVGYSGPGQFTLTFGGSFSGFAQPVGSWFTVPGGTAVTTAPGSIQINEVTAGRGGTIIENGAALQLEGGITIGGEPLIIHGQGNAAPTTVTPQWFNVGPAPITGGQTQGSQNVSGRVTGIAVVKDPVSLKDVYYISTAGGGAWKSIDGGVSWHQLFDAIPAIQNVTVGGSAGGTFTLTFTYNGQSQSATFNANSPTLADDIRKALNGFSNVGGVGGVVAVTQSASASVFTVTFGGTLLGQNIPLMTSSTTGGTTAAVSLVESGTDPKYALYVGAITVLGNTVYVGTGEADNSSDSFYGTGVYMSQDGGITWQLLVDNVTTPGTPFNPIAGKGVSKIAVDPFDGTVYVATTDRVTNAPAGSSVVGQTPAGVWRFFNGAWFCMTDVISSSRATLKGQQAAPPDTPGPDDDFRATFPQQNVNWSDLQLIYTDTSNLGAGTPPFFPPVPVLYAALGNGGGTASGVYRCQNPEDLTQPVWLVGDPGKPQNEIEEITITGPAGGLFNLTFKNQTTNNLAYDNNSNQSGLIQNALQSLSTIGIGNVSVSQVSQNSQTSVYDVQFVNQMANSSQPLIGSIIAIGSGLSITVTVKQAGGGVDTESSNEFPLGDFTTGIAINGNVKFSAVAGKTLNTTTVFAAVEWIDPRPNPSVVGKLRDVYVTNDGGKDWAATAAQPANFLDVHGDYAMTVVAQNANTVYVGGSTDNLATGQDMIFGTTNAGGIWNPLSVDNGGNGPHTAQHAFALDSAGNLLAGNDGGIWRLDNLTKWTNLNSNLSTALVRGVAADPANLNRIFAGSQGNGTEQYSGSLAWAMADDAAGGLIDGSRLFIDPTNPQTVYSVQGAMFGGGYLRVSTQGGAPGTWTTVQNIAITDPVVLDTQNPARILMGTGGQLYEVSGQGTTRTSLNLGTHLPIGRTPVAIAIAQFQGPFVGDTGFPGVTDLGSNTYDPNTIYATDGTSVYVTKDHGQTWLNRSSAPLFGAGSIVDLEVDPSNRDTVYVVRNAFGGGRVYKSTNAGQSWVEIGANDGLPNVPTSKLVIDPRNGNLYIGTDIGVFQLAGGSGTWQRFGANLPNVSVRDMLLNQTNNTLVIGTYGRGVFQLYLDAPQTTAGSLTGALIALSGSSVWTGPVRLAGDPVTNLVTLAGGGTQALRNGISTANVNIIGTVSDLTFNGNPTVVKAGNGNVTLSGPNVYGGVTDVQQGALVVDNPQALGAITANTIVETGAALQLESSVNLEPVTLHGDGPQPGFNGHNTGALESIANNNVFTGTITLASNATIGVDSGSTLTVSGTGTITDDGLNRSLTKEGTGRLILASADNYTGTTFVDRGQLQVQNSAALGTGPNNATVVLDGAVLELAAPAGGSVVINQPLSLTGTGIGGTGALLDIGGNNTWQGPVTLDARPGFAPTTEPSGTVAVGVTNAADSLTLSGGIGEAQFNGASLFSGLTKVGAGTLVLNAVDTYAGTTYVNTGTVTVQNNKALGELSGENTGAQEIQRVNVVSPAASGQFFLTLSGQNTAAVTLTTLFGTQAAATSAANTAANSLQGNLNAVLSSIYGSSAAANAVVTGVAVPTGTVVGGQSLFEFIFTVVFQGTTLVPAAGLPLNLPQMIATAANGATATASTVADGGVGTVVASGAALDLDGSAGALTVSGEALHLNGTGIGGTGALRNLAGNNTWTSTPPITAVTLDSAASIGVDAGSGLTVKGDVAGGSQASLTKVGAGTLLFPAANDYQGTTIVQNGILNIANPLSLGQGLTNSVQAVTITAPVNGTFQLTFNGQTTGQLQTGVAASGGATPTSSVQNALDSIISGGGSVTVTGVTNGNTTTYTVTFNGGPLAGVDQPQMSVSTSANVTGTVVVQTHGGLGGTQVQNGGTLQMQGGIAVSNEPLTLTGNGFAPGGVGIGALDSSSGSNTWDAPITLAGASTVAVDAGSLTADQAIGGSPVTSALTKIGAGTLAFTGTAANTYTGTTTVNDGTLILGKAGGAIAVAGNLVVGDGVAVDPPDVVQLQAPDQIATTATVTVNADGLFDLHNQPSQTLAALVINDGIATTDAAGTGNVGTLTVNRLNMAGGTLATSGAASAVILGGNVQASSDATGGATINGGGTLYLGGLPRTFTVTHGTGSPATSDLIITTPLKDQVPAGTGAHGALIKSGGGTLELDANSTVGLTSTTTVIGGTLDVVGAINNGLVQAGEMIVAPGGSAGAVTVNGGVLRVDGTAGEVDLNGAAASLTGTGQVANVDNGTSTSAPSGTIAPGDNDTANPVGTLTSTPPTGTQTWGSGTTLSVDLVNAAGGPGVGNDLYVVNGNLNLGNGVATLTGTVGPNVKLHDSFTIIETIGGSISGTFAAPQSAGVVFIAGQKFSVTYNLTSVVLNRVVNRATVALSSAPSPSVYGQDIMFTATVTPEPGAGIPVGDTVMFVLHGVPGGDVTTTGTVNTSGQASFDLKNVVSQPLPVGTYTLDATFNPGGTDPLYGTATAQTYTQTVTKSPTATAISPASVNVVYGQSFTLGASVTATGGGVGTPAGTVTFLIDGGTAGGGEQETVSLSSGQASVTVPDATLTQVLSVGNHTVNVTYSGDGNFQGSDTHLKPLTVVVSKDADTVTPAASPASPQVVGTPVTFTLNISTNSPGTATPGGTVTITDTTTSTVLGTPSVVVDSSTTGHASLTTSALAPGSHTIAFSYGGTTQESANSTSFVYVVSQIATRTQLTASPNPAVYGQTVSFTATVAVNGAGSGTPGGTVTFTDGAQTLGTVSLTANGSTGVAVLSVNASSLPAGASNVVATYNGATNYAGSSTSLSETVNFTTATTLTSSANPVSVGQPVTFTATVAPGSGMPAGTPGGSVTFTDTTTSTNLGTQSLSGGTATLQVTNFVAGTHAVTATYNPAVGSAYLTSTSAAVKESVLSPSSVTLNLTAGQNPATYGQPLTFSATVTATAAGAPTPTGTVTFFDGTASLGSQTLNGGQASITVNNLSASGHSITASYAGDSSTAPNTSPGLNLTVNADPTSVTVTSSANPAAVGSPVTFTATVSPKAPGTLTPTGSVTFIIDGGTTQQTVTLAGGTATYNAGVLSQGSHSVVVQYNSNTTNFTNSVSPTFTENVSIASSTALASSANPALVGQLVSFTATVSVTQGGPPTGSVTFTDGSNTLATIPLNNSNQAVFNTSGLSAGTHNITATYNPSSSSFSGSSNSLTEVVNYATNTTLSSSPNPSAFGQSVTFTATVQAGVVPTGTVTFTDTTTSTTLQTVNLSAGSGNTATASYSTASLAVGTHAVVATYNPAAGSNFNGSASTTDNQAVQSVSGMTLTSSQNPQGFGQPVTFSATVSATSPGAQTPTGTVTFTDTTTNATLGTGTLTMTGPTSAVATLTLSSLGVGPHHIVASYPGDGATAAATANVTQTIQAAATTTALSSSVNPSVVGQAVTFTATVTPAGSGTPTGFVTFTDLSTGATLGIPSLSGGMATVTVSSLAHGAHNIQATYNGSATFAGSPSNVVAQNVLYTTTTYVWSSAYTSPSLAVTPGEALTFTALVIPANGAPTATGTIQFFDNGTPLGTAPMSSGAATLPVSAGLSAGTHTITVKYSGDNNDIASNGTFSQPVIASLYGSAAFANGGPGADAAHSPFNVTTYALDSNFFTDGQYNEAATVRIVGDPAGGTFSNGSMAVGGTFSGGILSLGNLTVTTRGVYTLEVDSGTLATQMTIQVLAPDATYVWSSLYASTPNQPVTFTALVLPGTNVGTPMGTIQFFNNGVSMGTVPLTNGAATLSTAGFAAGSYNITAQYSGDATYIGTTGTFTQSVIGYLYGATSVGTDSQGKTLLSVTAYALDAGTFATDANYSEPVVLKITSAPSGGTFTTGTTSVSGVFSGGKMTFSGLQFTKTGTYQLEIDSGTLTFTGQSLLVNATGRST